MTACRPVFKKGIELTRSKLNTLITLRMRNAVIKTNPVGTQQAKNEQSKSNHTLDSFVKFAGKIGNHEPNLTGFAPNDPVGVEYRFRRSVAQPGSAPALGAGGPRFESLYSDHFPYLVLDSSFNSSIYLPIAQLDRATPF